MEFIRASTECIIATWMPLCAALFSASVTSASCPSVRSSGKAVVIWSEGISSTICRSS